MTDHHTPCKECRSTTGKVRYSVASGTYCPECLLLRQRFGDFNEGVDQPIEDEMSRSDTDYKRRGLAVTRERNICAALVDDMANAPQSIRLAAGEMTAQEMRTVQSVLRWAAHRIREIRT